MLKQSIGAIRRYSQTSAKCTVDIDWSHPAFAQTPELASGFSQLRTWAATGDALYETYKTAPSPIDFTKVKQSVRDKELISTLEKFYTTVRPPPEEHVMSEEMKQDHLDVIAFSEAVQELNQELLPILEKEIDFFQKNRTTKDTTILDMRMNYPMMHEEIEDELERREWFKDTNFDTSKNQ